MGPLRSFKPDQCCHPISRIANRAFFLSDEEKTRFVERLWRVAAFPGVEVLAYCFMSNHFHLLVYVPNPRELSDDELLARIRTLYAGTRLAGIGRERIRKLHEKSIHLVLKELEDERLAGRAKKGRSVDDEKQQKARQRDFSRFE